MFHVFCNGMAIVAVGFTSRSKIAIGLILASNLVAFMELAYRVEIE